MPNILGRYVTSIPKGQNIALLEEIRVTIAGTAAGTSVDMAKLGLKVTAMGAIGDDELGNFLVNTMKKYGKENGAVTTFDLVAIDRPDLLELINPCLPYIDYFMPGLEEAEMMTGLKDRQEIIRYFLDKGVKCTVFKMGEKGSSIAYYENKELVETITPVIESKIVDSTGCGDSYCAGFITGLSKGWELEKCAEFGTACGSLVISGLGSDAGIIDFDSTYEYMKKSFS